MATQLVLGDRARRHVARGINTVADAVKVTLGPKGRNVVLSASRGLPRIPTTVPPAEEINLADPFADVGAQLVKQVAVARPAKTPRRHHHSNGAGPSDDRWGPAQHHGRR